MKKVLKWLAISVLGVVAVLAAIGWLMLDTPQPSQQANASTTPPTANPSVVQSAPAPVAPKTSYAPDQCLDKVCIGMTAGELVGMAWSKKDEITDSDINSQQRELLEYDQKAHSEKCQSKQTAWGRKSAEMCDLLSRGTSNPRSYKYRLYQVPKVLDFFENQSTPVCEYYETERAYVLGYFKTETGNTMVTLKFDANGMLRVQEISKAYNDQNAETNAAIESKLLEKHPYVANTPELRRNQKSGEAAWGGKVTIEKDSGRAPMIWMTAKPSDFDQSNLAACKQTKPISVQ